MKVSQMKFIWVEQPYWQQVSSYRWERVERGWLAPTCFDNLRRIMQS